MDAKYLAEIKAREQAAKDVLAKAELRYDTEYRPLLEAISDIPALLAEVERLTEENAELKKSEIDSAGIEQIKKALGESVENIIAEHNRIIRSVKEENATLTRALELAVEDRTSNPKAIKKLVELYIQQAQEQEEAK
jgi:hypothetical protein